MNWIVASLIMFLSSIIYYLTIRLGQKKGVTVKEYMAINYPLPALVFFLMNVWNKTSFTVPLPVIPLILFHGIILEYIGGTLSYKAIHAAPNAGYSLVIQKSYAIFTSIAAIFLFNASLPFWKFCMILMIIFFAGILSLGGKEKNKTKSNWFILSLIPFFFFGSNSLVSKYAVSIEGASLISYLFWLFLLMTVITSIDIIRGKNKVAFNINHWKTLTLIGISGTSFYYFKNVAQIAAPNIGYVGAINTASNAFVVVLVALLYKEHMSWIKLVAVLGIVVGIIYIIL
jgi:drug/metabolite transporter (DMT)-like permease